MTSLAPLPESMEWVAPKAFLANIQQVLLRRMRPE
jgi:hypothetical protein